VIDYVVAHELAHLRAMDHSADFWQEVEQILPGYKEAQSQLKGVTLEI
jgi:predicted metal-dependent hydrolase